MKKFFIFLALFAAAACLPVSAQTDEKTEDVQFWSDTTLTFPLLKRKDNSEKVNFFVTGTFRAGDNLTRAIDQRIGAGFDFVINKYVTFSPSYLYRAEQPVTGGKAFEHRVRYDTTLKYDFKSKYVTGKDADGKETEKSYTRFSIKDRNRFEHRIRHSRGDTLRYRNKITASMPLYKDETADDGKLTKKHFLEPFVATEPFYDFRDDKWFRNELSFGVIRKFGDHSAEFYYMWQRNFQAPLKNVNVIGVNLKFKIDR